MKIRKKFIPKCLLLSCILLISFGVAGPPQILEPLRNTNGLEGGSVLFRSTVSATPSAEFDCSLDDWEIPIGVYDKYWLTYDGKEAKLKLNDLELHENYVVRFGFENDYGRGTTSAKLTVIPQTTL